MGFMSHRIERDILEAGDHIYTWRTGFPYSHHGIYIGEDRVVHFTQTPNLSPSVNSESTPFPSHNWSSSVNSESTCFPSHDWSSSVNSESTRFPSHNWSSSVNSESKCFPSHNWSSSVNSESTSLPTHNWSSSENLYSTFFSSHNWSSSVNSESTSYPTHNWSSSENLYSTLFSSHNCSSSNSESTRLPTHNWSSSENSCSTCFSSHNWSSSVSSGSPCLSLLDSPIFCGFRKGESGVTLSCLNCFLDNGSLYRYQYGVSPHTFIVKRGGNCTTAKSDDPEAVIHRAMYLLDNGFGEYQLLKHNCEDFALYCKTGLLVSCKLDDVGASGQASSGYTIPGAAISSLPDRLFFSNPFVLGTVAAVHYATYRYSRDIGARKDVVKVEAKDVAALLQRRW